MNIVPSDARITSSILMLGTDHSVFADAAASLVVWACAATISGAVRSHTSSQANIRGGLRKPIARRNRTNRRLSEPVIGRRQQRDAERGLAVGPRKIARL
jgi:hypothetical protein